MWGVGSRRSLVGLDLWTWGGELASSPTWGWDLEFSWESRGLRVRGGRAVACRQVFKMWRRVWCEVPPVGVDQVLGLVKVIYQLGGRVDAMNINEAVDADLGDLAHVIDAGERLGLVRAAGGDLELTAAGRDAVEKPLREFQKYLRRRLSDVEPFASLATWPRGGESRWARFWSSSPSLDTATEGRGGCWTGLCLPRWWR